MATHCPGCQKEYELFDRISNPVMCSSCFKKGRRLPTEELSTPKTLEQNKFSTSARYPALQMLAGLYVALAIFVGIGASIVVVIGFANREDGGILLTVLGVLGGAMGVIINLSIAEGIRVIIDIEENTRRSADVAWNRQSEAADI